MKKNIAVLLASVLLLSACKAATAPSAETSMEEVAPTTQQGVAPGEATGEEMGGTEGTKGAVKEFTVSGDDFKFDTTEIKVNAGDTVRITFTNAEGMHDWVLDEFNAKTQVLKAGTSETVEFVADKAGTYEYYCSVGQHRKMGMKGNLIVE